MFASAYVFAWDMRKNYVWSFSHLVPALSDVPQPCSWGGEEQVPDKNCLYLRGKDFLYQPVLCYKSQMLTSALAKEVRVLLFS